MAPPPNPSPHSGRCGWSQSPRTSSNDVAAVGAAPQRVRLGAGPDDVGVVRVGRDLPDARQRGPGVLGEG